MKYLIYIGILLGIVLLPVQGTDVGKLLPVEVVAISETEGVVKITTDTENEGYGTSLQTALDDLKAGAPGIIYLDTAQYLLLEKGMEATLDTVERHLKQDAYLCYADEKVPLEAVADFLSVHKPSVTLGTVSDYGTIPMITEENGNYRLIEN